MATTTSLLPALIESCVANIPILNIEEIINNKLYQNRLMTIGLLGTEVTMEYDFYLNCLTKNGIRMLLPSKWDRSNIDKLIFTELTRGKFSDSTRIQFEKIIKRMKNNGGEELF